MRVYLDTNVLSLLRTNSAYSSILQLINDYNRKHTYFYSSAHMEDLKRDKTDEKYSDLDFIKKVSNGNYLCKFWNEETNCYIMEPQDAFINVDKNDDIFDNFADLVEESDFKDKVEELKDSLGKIDTSTINIDSIPEPLKSYLEGLFDLKKNFDFNNLIHIGLNYYQNIQNSKDGYKNLRRYIKSHHNHIFPDFPPEINSENINNLFSKSFFKQPFLEYVSNILFVNPTNEEDKKYYTFLSSYNILNSFGLDRERNKKANFNSTTNDGLHAYYAGYCDILVTEDNGLKEKAILLYKLFNIDTLIVTIAEFQDYLHIINKNEEYLKNKFTNHIVKDIKRKDVVYITEKEDKIICKCRVETPYFANFQYLQFSLCKSNYQFNDFILLSSTKKMGRRIFFKEIEVITNYCIKQIGIDYECKGEFKNEEFDEINKNTWNGRFWYIGNGGYLYLNIDMNTCVYFLEIKSNSNVSKVVSLD